MKTSILQSMPKCLRVISSSRLKNFRMGSNITIIIAQPEKMAPATKYGAKIVLCQPGIRDTAKSQLTTL